MRLVAFYLALAAMACVTRHRIEIDGTALHQQSHVLRASNAATVAAIYATDDDYADSRQVTEPITIDQTVVDRSGRTRWVRDLLRGCADRVYSIAANPDCELVTAPTYYKVRTWETHSTTRFIQLAALGTFGGALIGAAGCAFMCPEGSTIDTISEGTVAVVGTLFVGALVWAVIDCMGHWGQPGCRD